MGDFFVVTLISGGLSGSATSGIFNDLQFLNYPRAAARAEARERRQAKDEKFVPTEPRPTYKEPSEVTAMVLAYRDQIKFLDRLKLVANAILGVRLGAGKHRAR